ncbi:glycosyltransferase family 2 protein [Polaromonas sp. JS666]|uniref:glycosyltransferase family 2 protein n=1 Tax=Polaromonas sp. (strain JS666 / ATCC BAA-500) TaxID=296591 RepID=UPI0008850A84|nr:glycosyltransferase family 2 protein [Polaromonas sp. JS666]SDN80337.1 Glycosyltransferase involved in cell wall bisynthesis [Polaromonas sp. JS666]
MPHTVPLSIVLPARNEATGLRDLLPRILAAAPEAEVLVVDDGSTDDTPAVCAGHRVKHLRHPYAKGNGAAIKTGARAALGEVIVFMDADGQHKPEDIPSLLEEFNKGYDMVVGARQAGSQAGLHRAAANDIFSRFASWMVMQPIADLTSGFRVVRAAKFRQFLYLLPNGFSYPTTITMSFFRAGYGVAYVPIHSPRRSSGASHIHPLRDGLRFLLIIIKIGTLFSPQKLFLPISAGFFLTGLAYYLYTYMTAGRFTNMSALLFISAVFTFLIGIVSEQISALHYKNIDTSDRESE